MGPFFSGCDVELETHAAELPWQPWWRAEIKSDHGDDEHVWMWAAAADQFVAKRLLGGGASGTAATSRVAVAHERINA